MQKWTIWLVIAFAFSGQAAYAASLRVLTYNAGLLRITFKGDVVPKVKARAEKLPAALSQLAEREKLDLISLQEVWDSSHQAAIAKALKAQGFEIILVDDLKPTGDFPTLTLMGSGMMVAYRNLTADSIARIPFTSASSAQKLARKGIVSMKLKTKSGQPQEESFVFTTVHTQNLDGKDGSVEDPDAKEHLLKQIQQLTEHHKTASLEGAVPLLSMGDFNCGPEFGKTVFESLVSGLGVRAVYSEVNGRYDATWDSSTNRYVIEGEYPNGPNQTVDHVFVRDAKGDAGHWKTLAARIVMKTDNDLLSDHYGVIAELELTPTPPSK
ncbi:MAG: endonuclease/exonuclease/phosphatase family protein [Bacteriovoracia bacterium]